MAEDRESICKRLGFSGVVELHTFIVDSIRADIAALTRRGLSASTLTELGYTRGGLARLGCKASQLAKIGLESSKPSPTPQESPKPSDLPPTSPDSHVDVERIKALLDEETPYGALKGMGITAQHCRTAGADVTLLLRLGFPMSEMAQAYSLHELHRAGYHVRDLSNYFSDEQLKSAGFSASEMRMAGRSIRQLQRLGYNDNHIRTAGYSLSELIAAGLAKQTRDSIRGM